MSKYCYECCSFVECTTDIFGNTVCPKCRRTIEELPMEEQVNNIMNEFNRLIFEAEIRDYHFKSENYLWVMGSDIWFMILKYLESYLMLYKSETGLPYDTFMGINFMLDRNNPKRISLYMEVKK